jgi:hypothetical protein
MMAFDARNANVHRKTKKQSNLLLNGWSIAMKRIKPFPLPFQISLITTITMYA